MRALVIGGSLGGLFAANLLRRRRWQVEVFEHSFARYERERTRFGLAVVSRARALGAWLQGRTDAEAMSHHTPVAVMREIAVTRDFPQRAQRTPRR